MIGNKPAFFIPDVFDCAVQPRALFSQSFEKVCGGRSLSGFDCEKISTVQRNLFDCQLSLKELYPDDEITCVFSHNGAYWLNRDALGLSLHAIDDQLDRLSGKSRVPVWKLTVEELLSYHRDNLRYLVQASTNDSIIFGNLSQRLNGQQESLTRLFKTCWQKVFSLSEGVERWTTNRMEYINEYVVLLDRCRITRTLLNCGEINEDKLGYTAEDLLQAERFLEDRCFNLDPNFQERQKKVYQELLRDLLAGERLQRLRAQQWEDVFDSLGGPPEGYRGFSSVLERERRGLDSFCSTRVRELEIDAYCATVLIDVRDEYVEFTEVAETPAEDGAALTEEQIQNLLEMNNDSKEEEITDENSTESPSKKKLGNRVGMAFLNRRR